MLRARAARAALAVGISVLATLMSTGSVQAAEPTTYPVQTTTMTASQTGDSGARSGLMSTLGDCPANNICFFDGYNYTAELWWRPLPNNTVYCYDIPWIQSSPWIALHVGRSVYNNTGGRVIIYFGTPCSVFTVQTELGPYEGWAGYAPYEAMWYKRN